MRMVTEAGPVLVTGGAGYIGSHAVWALVDAGRDVVVLDDLSYGRREALPPGIGLVVGSVGDRNLVERLLAEHGVSTVLHFAGSVLVGQSVSDPLGYYANNTVNSHALLQACVAVGVKNFIFSSTAAVYGMPETQPIGETAPTKPINPYGASKLMTEMMLRDTGTAHGLGHVILRYFNVAGADAQGRTGERRPMATHLINVATQVALGKRPLIEIFGEDYDTPDGTCIRDYIHVSDLADAHLKAVEHLERGGESLTLNCGYGRGASVRDVLSQVEAVAGCKLAIRPAPRRPGDPPRLVAAADRIRALLGWQPQHDDLAATIRSALDWERSLAAAAAVSA
jgi:UDP-glucose 4-epimerase